MQTKRYLFAFCALLAGCESAPPGGRPGPYVKPGLIMIPADQAQLYGVSGGQARSPDQPPPADYATTDIRSVQTESAVSAIQFNRYADPTRPNELMHEAHIVYRREGPPRWRLQPASAGQQILIGPNLTEGRGEVKPLASQELDGYLREQRVNLQKQQQVMGQVTEGMRQLAEQQQQLAKELVDLRANSINGIQKETTKESKPEAGSNLPPAPLPTSDREQPVTKS